MSRDLPKHQSASVGDGLGCAPARYVGELSRRPGGGRAFLSGRIGARQRRTKLSGCWTAISANGEFASGSRSNISRESRSLPEKRTIRLVWMDAESKRRNIKQNYEFVVRSIDPEKKEVQGLYNYKIPYDLLVMVPPHRPAQVLLDSGLADD